MSHIAQNVDGQPNEEDEVCCDWELNWSQLRFKNWSANELFFFLIICA